jgi:hypothetical protein
VGGKRGKRGGFVELLERENYRGRDSGSARRYVSSGGGYHDIMKSIAYAGVLSGVAAHPSSASVFLGCFGIFFAFVYIGNILGAGNTHVDTLIMLSPPYVHISIHIIV